MIKTKILKGVRIFLMIFSSFQYFYGMKDGICDEESEINEINNNKQKDKKNKGKYYY